MKGTIYKIHNKVKNTCYIGSTIQNNAKKRYWRHKQDYQLSRYENLFEDDTDFIIVAEVELNNKTELRELEQFFINVANSSGENCINKNWSYVPDHLKVQRRKMYCKKHNDTEKGKENRRWQGWRHYHRNKINQEIIKYFSKI
jgi:hypothetical protein